MEPARRWRMLEQGCDECSAWIWWLLHIRVPAALRNEPLLIRDASIIGLTLRGNCLDLDFPSMHWRRDGKFSSRTGKTRLERHWCNFADVFIHGYIVYLALMVSFIENKHRDHRPFRWPESCTRSRPSNHPSNSIHLCIVQPSQSHIVKT